MPLFKQREKFDRSDVPHNTPYRNIIGLVVVVAVFALLGLTVRTIYNRVQLEARLGDRDLASAVQGQGSVTPPGGYADATDAFERTLVLTVSEDAEGAQTISKAQVVVLNLSQKTGAVAELPLDSAVGTDDSKSTISDLVAKDGASACVGPLSTATGIKFDGVVVQDEDTLDALAGLAGSDERGLYASAALPKLRTSMDATNLLDWADALAEVGVANLAPVEVQQYAETTTDADGNTVETGLKLIDSTTLRIQLGLLIAAA